jgi:hypothetical protein
MNTASHRRMLVLWVVALAAALALLAAAGTAWAQPPIRDTNVEKLSETFTDRLLCQDDLYVISGNGHSVEHFTYFEETGALHYHFLVHAKLVAVPLDGTGPTYIGHFRSSDSENIRNVKQGDVLVETDTDHNKTILKGSDGSRIFLQEHAHFTFNANGEVTVEFEKVRESC